MSTPHPWQARRRTRRGTLAERPDGTRDGSPASLPADRNRAGGCGSGLAGWGYQADNRQLAVGLALVLREAGRGLGDLLPGLRTLRPVQLLGRHADPPAVHFDLHVVGVSGDVVIP